MTTENSYTDLTTPINYQTDDFGEAFANGWLEFMGYDSPLQMSRRLEEERQKANMQTDSQMKLNKQQYNFNEYMWNKAADWNSASSEVARLKEAGLNPALMYSGAGGGGTTAATTGQGGQATGGGNAPVKEGKGLDLIARLNDMKLIQAQTNALNAEAEKNRAEAESTGTHTDYFKDVKDILWENARQEGKEKWIENLQKYYQDANLDKLEEDHNLYGMHMITSANRLTQKEMAIINKTVTEVEKNEADKKRILSEIALNNKNVQYLQAKIINESRQTNNEEELIRKKLQEIEAIIEQIEYETGEKWNTKQVIKAISDGVGTATGAFVGGVIGSRGLKGGKMKGAGADGYPTGKSYDWKNPKNNPR